MLFIIVLLLILFLTVFLTYNSPNYNSQNYNSPNYNSQNYIESFLEFHNKFLPANAPISYYKKMAKFYINPNLIELPAVDQIPTYNAVPADIDITTSRGPPSLMEETMGCKYNCHKSCISVNPSVGCSRQCFDNCNKPNLLLPIGWSSK